MKFLIIVAARLGSSVCLGVKLTKGSPCGTTRDGDVLGQRLQALAHGNKESGQSYIDFLKDITQDCEKKREREKKILADLEEKFEAPRKVGQEGRLRLAFLDRLRLAVFDGKGSSASVRSDSASSRASGMSTPRSYVMRAGDVSSIESSDSSPVERNGGPPRGGPPRRRPSDKPIGLNKLHASSVSRSHSPAPSNSSQRSFGSCILLPTKEDGATESRTASTDSLKLRCEPDELDGDGKIVPPHDDDDDDDDATDFASDSDRMSVSPSEGSTASSQ